MQKDIENYFKKHPTYNSLVHSIGGMGVGILIGWPLASQHPVRWGITLIALSILGHLYAAKNK